MGKYGPGLTIGQVFNLEKEQVRHALKGELMCGEDGNGFIYRKAAKEECDRYILSAFDNAVFHLLEANKFCRVYDEILERKGVRLTVQDILLGKAIEDCKTEDYHFGVYDCEEFEEGEG